MANSELNNHRNEILNSFKGIDDKIKNYVSALRKKSSDEILNGSVIEAQRLISQIIPIEEASVKIKKNQQDLIKILESQVENENPQPAAPEIIIENNEYLKSEPEEKSIVDEYVVNPDEDFTPQYAFRTPILKALIYLGGSAPEKDIITFIEKDMKNKFRDKDHEIFNGHNEKRWITLMRNEREEMVTEGLLATETGDGNWEIVQKGIDFLAKKNKK